MNQAVAAARAVFFDFDFTLADSSEGIVVCMNHALARLGLPPASADAIRRTIGLDLHTALANLAGEEVDARAAQAAGVGFVAVLSGTTAEGVFARYPARAVLGGVGEIVPEK